MTMKLAVVGGGSTYTPELVDGFARLADRLPVSEIALIDPDVERTELVAGMSRRMLRRMGSSTTVSTATDVASGAEDADAVLIQLRVGGQQARLGDETFPHRCGCIGQETTGPGGLAKALRTVPVVRQIADTVRRVAPSAGIVDFTNPVGIVTRALLEDGHRAVGLCNVAIGFQRRFAAMLGVAPGEIELDHVGLNHLTWVRGVTAGREAVLGKLLAAHRDEIADDVELPVALLDLLGCVPSYYLRYYYAHDEVLREQLAGPARAEQVQSVERELLALYADPTVDTKPEALSRRGGAFYSEAAVDLLVALSDPEGSRLVVNVRNNGALPFLPDDHVVEMATTVSATGIDVPAARVGELALPDDIAGLITAVAGYERLALDAAVHGGRDRVVHALLAHPLVGQYDRADALADLLIAGNVDHLPWARP